MAALTNRLIVISLDCLSANDYPIIKKLPNFKRILKHGSFVREVETIYPSLTYPCHTTIVTGKFPKKHGIVNNTLLQPGRPSPDWNWYRSKIKGTTLYDEAYKANLTTAALLWPVTGKAKSIQYNLPEIFANRPWHHQIIVSLMNGTPSYQWELNKLFGHIRNGIKQPQLDDFVLQSTVHTIRTKRPNLLLVHFTDLDTMRHDYGVASEEAIEALHRHDERLGAILDAVEDNGNDKETTIVVLGDHAALDENKAVSVNVALRNNGLITVNPKGKMIDWKAYCKGCDGSAYIYLKDRHDSETKEKVEKVLYHLMKESKNGIETVITGEDASELGADPECSFMLEAALGFYFIEDYQGDYLRFVTLDNRHENDKYMLASHGYSPEKLEYKTFLFAAGKGIRANEEIPFARLIDIGPTLAKLLDLDLGNTDGNVIQGLLEGD